MAKDYHEWLEQSEYDIDTADAMLRTGRYFYAVFMCHLSIEKALKGVYQFKQNDLQPKTHNLIRLLHKSNIAPNESVFRFIVKLNEASVATRYPEDIKVISVQYDRSKALEIITQTKETLQWIKSLFS